MAGLKINEFSREKMDTSMKELTREESLVYSCLNLILSVFVFAVLLFKKKIFFLFLNH
jgi:hypothetical protein